MNPVPSKLNPVAPAPRETAYDAVAVWALREPPRRLATLSILGAEATLAVAVLAPAAWLLAVPLVCIGAASAWGLAAQRIQALDAAQEPAPVRRFLLKAAQAGAVAIGTVAAIAGFYGVLLLVLGPGWTL